MADHSALTEESIGLIPTNGLILYFGVILVATIALVVAASSQHGRNVAWTSLQSIITQNTAVFPADSCSINSKSIKSLLSFLISWSMVGIILGYAFLCEHFPFYPHMSKMVWDPDQFVTYLVVFILFGLVCGTRDQENKCTITLLEKDYRAIQELKGCAFFCFCLFRYFEHDGNANSTILEHLFIAFHVWETSLHCATSFGTSGDYSLRRIVQSLWRPWSMLIWFGMGLVATSKGPSGTFLLYYLCLLDTLAVALCFVVFRLGSLLNTRIGWWGLRLTLLAVAIVGYFVWDVANPQLFVSIFGPFFNDTKSSKNDRLMNLWMWELYSTQYHWCIVFGIAQALNLPIFDAWRERLEHQRDGSSTPVRSLAVAIGLLLANFGLWHWMRSAPSMSALESSLDLKTKYLAPLVIATLFYLRTCTRRLCLCHFPLFQLIGACSLEAFVLHHHIFLSSNGNAIFALISPGWSKLNFVITIFFLGIFSFIFFCANNNLLSVLLCDTGNWARNLLVAGTSLAVCVLLVALLKTCGMLAAWAIIALAVMMGIAVYSVVVQHVRDQSTLSTAPTVALKHCFPLYITTMCLLAIVFRWSSPNGPVNPETTSLIASCGRAVQEGSWIPLEICNEAARSSAYRRYNTSSVATCSSTQHVFGWGWKKQSWPLFSKCQPSARDTFTLLHHSLRHKNLTFVGDSEIRHLYHATCRQVGDTAAGAYNTSLGKWSNYDRHYKPDTHLHFRWAPYTDQLVATVDQIISDDKEQRPDALVIGGGAWDLLHRTRDRINQTLLDTNIKELAERLSTLRKLGQDIVWVEPTMINTWALMTEDKRKYMREDQMVLHRKKYVDLGVTSSPTWVLKGLAWTVERVDECYDGVHYPFSVYDGGSQILLNALEWVLPFTQPEVEVGMRASPMLGLCAVFLLIVCLVLMDSLFGLSYIVWLFKPSLSPANFSDQSLGNRNQGDSLPSNKRKTSEITEGDEIDAAELDAILTAESMEVEPKTPVSSIKSVVTQANGSNRQGAAILIASVFALYLPFASGFVYNNAARIAKCQKRPRKSLLQVSVEGDEERRKCFYKSPSRNNWWLPRSELSELTIGQELQATIVQEFLDGKTGPKLFCEVGVGRCRNGQDWKIVNAMLRMGLRGAKKSVTAKRVARLRKKDNGFPVYVTKVRPENDQLEVSLSLSDAKEAEQEPKRVAVSKLNVGQELEGTVVRIEPYGVVVDVGANRHGLLHIRKVSQLMQRYIDQEGGLKEAGFKRGSRVLLQVESIKSKRLSLDFTGGVKQDAWQQTKKVNTKRNRKAAVENSPADTKPANIPAESSGSSPAPSASDSPTELTASEEEAWAAYAAQQENSEAEETEAEEDEYEYDESYEYDNYDEERDIEDALGLGTY